MHILENVSLKLHSTMRLGGNARFLCDITNESDLLEALQFAESKHIPVRAIGSGSNIIWHDQGFAGLLLVMKNSTYEFLDECTVRYDAGLVWDNAVKIAVDKGLSGIECLSLIPGTVGATPVQNVGAYGQEVAQTISLLRAYDMHQKKFVNLSADECAFTYRSSRFKSVDSGRYIITSVTFALSKKTLEAPLYDSLQSYIYEKNISTYDPQTIRDAVIAIRSAKLPDPAKIANNGSFFANPVVQKPHFDKLRLQYPDIKGWPTSDGTVKIAAGWLIEHAGFSDYHDAETGMATWRNQNLVLINEHAQSTQQLLDFKQKITAKVYDTFGITLDQEPELLP